MPRIAIVSACVLVASLGCGAPEPPVCAAGAAEPRGPVPDIGFLAPPPIGVEGEKVSVALFRAPSFTCGAPQPASGGGVITEVLDPLNQPVEHSTVDMGGQVELTFTPAIPGWYHASVTFPEALAQSDVLVAEDRRDHAVVELPARCETVQRTQSGALLCDAKVFRGAQSVQSLSGHLAVSGDVVWQVAGGQLSRWVDPGTGALVQEPATSVALPAGIILHLLAAESDAIVITSGKLGRYAVASSGALERSGEVAIAFSPGIALRQGHEVLVVEGQPRAAPVPPQDKVGAMPAFSACIHVFDVSAAPVERSSGAGCRTLPGEVVGTQGGQLWAFGSTVAVLELSNGELVVLATPRLPGGTTLFASRGGAPRVSDPQGAWFIPRLEGGLLSLEKYQASAEFAFAGASDALVWEHASVATKTRVSMR